MGEMSVGITLNWDTCVGQICEFWITWFMALFQQWYKPGNMVSNWQCNRAKKQNWKHFCLRLASSSSGLLPDFETHNGQQLVRSPVATWIRSCALSTCLYGRPDFSLYVLSMLLGCLHRLPSFSPPSGIPAVGAIFCYCYCYCILDSELIVRQQ